MGKKLSEDEVQHALDFCVHLFSPTTPEQHEHARKKLGDALAFAEEEREHAGRDDDEDEEEKQASERQSKHDQEEQSFTAARLLDVKSPVIDPSALARILKARLSLAGVFRRTQSSPAVIGDLKGLCSVQPQPDLPVDDRPSSPASEPSSPVSAAFSVSSGSGTNSSWMNKRSRSSTTTMNKDNDDDDDDDDDKAGEHDQVMMVLEKVNARRVIHAEHGEGLNSLEREAIAGMVMRLQRGHLGLARC